jgi:formylglycine-generating enzyme required for sulfatase activity
LDRFDPYHRWLGIRPEDQPPNHYRLLGLSLWESDCEVIRDAADRQMAHVRTYQLGPNSAQSQRVLNELGAATACLLDPQKRADYDAILRHEMDSTQRPPEPPSPSPPLPPSPLPRLAPKQHSLNWLAVLAAGGAALLCLTTLVAGVKLLGRNEKQVADSAGKTVAATDEILPSTTNQLPQPKPAATAPPTALEPPVNSHKPTKAAEPLAPLEKPAPKEIAVELGNGVKLEMVLIPAGSFMMGDDTSGDVRPAHHVKITKPFYLGRYLVRQEQWEAVMANNPSHFKGPKNPVERVSWDDCRAFVGKLNEKYGGDGARYSLPTEAQWEYACRAGSVTRYCYGDDEILLGEYGWYDKNSQGKTHAVGEKQPNAWGLYDMHGNVWELCSDWYDRGYYANSPLDDPAGPSGGSNRVLRGGGWCCWARFCRSAYRGRAEPGRRGDALGFRVARGAE